MRILANENFPGDAITALRQCGHDVAWVRTDAPGSSDWQVLKRAETEDRVLITFDKDFGELAFRAKLPASSGIILLRISVPSAVPLCPPRVSRSLRLVPVSTTTA